MDKRRGKLRVNKDKTINF